MQWQCCQTHFMRNILGHYPHHLKKPLASELKLIFQAPNIDTARRLAKDLIATYEKKAKRAMVCLESGLEVSPCHINLP